MMPHPPNRRIDRRAMYQEMQRAIPGLDAMYRLVHAQIASHGHDKPQVLVVGAGGGREIEELLTSDVVGRITAVDPSARNLDTAREIAGSPRGSPEVRFIAGTADDLPEGETFDIVTSLLVMHHLQDDGTKLEYLQSLRARLAAGGCLILADACLDDRNDFGRMISVFQAHGGIFGVSEDATRLELDTIPKLPVVSGERVRDLFAAASLTEPFEVYRTLWYRCWVSSRDQRGSVNRTSGETGQALQASSNQNEGVDDDSI